MLEFLKGKKTFAVGLLMIALGILNSDMHMITEGFGFIFVRMAIK